MKVVGMNPGISIDSSTAVAGLGRTYLDAGRTEAAVAALAAASKATPDSADVWSMLALAYQEQKQPGAAIAAYKEFIKGSPQSPLVNQAILRINAIALDYARADSWDVAEGIYAGLLADKLATRDPERIEFSRGLCQIGKVMPEHAKEVLAAL